LIRIPREYHDLRERDRGLAQRWREAAAAAFVASFEQGLVATGFTDDSAYVLTEGR
jgi:predicted GNAT superfamily acetyltransferase